MFDIASLVVINMDGRFLPETLSGWNSHDVIFMNTCTRKTWIGRNKDFEDFPITHLPEDKSSYLCGKEAYAFLLRLKSGLESPKLGETNVDGQFIRDSLAFAQRCPDKFEQMSRFWDNLKADTKYIRANYIEPIQKGTIENAAKLISDFKKGQNALIIGKTGKNGIVSQVTLDLAFAVAHAGQIFYTSPDASALETIDSHLETPDVRKRIPLKTKLGKTTFADIPSVIAEGCHVYIDQPMGENGWNDSFLMNTWRAKTKTGFNMVHLRGSPSLRGGSTKMWKNAELPNYYGPEDVRQRKVQIDHDNVALVNKANNDIEIIAAVRSAGSNMHAYRAIKEHQCDSGSQGKLAFG